MMSVVITGNFLYGFAVHGPFNTREEAIEWASTNDWHFEDWFVMPLVASWNEERAEWR